MRLKAPRRNVAARAAICFSRRRTMTANSGSLDASHLRDVSCKLCGKRCPPLHTSLVRALPGLTRSSAWWAVMVSHQMSEAPSRVRWPEGQLLGREMSARRSSRCSIARAAATAASWWCVESQALARPRCSNTQSRQAPGFVWSVRSGWPDTRDFGSPRRYARSTLTPNPARTLALRSTRTETSKRQPPTS